MTLRAVAVLSICLLVPGFATADAPTGKLIIAVSNAQSDTGQICAALYNTPDTFPKAGQHYKFACAKITNSQATLVFSKLPPGEYAAFAYHDADKDRKMKTNLFGIPKEGVGASRGAKGRMGPPKFKDARFTLKTGTRKIPVKLTYI